MRKLLKVMNIFIIWILVKTSLVYTYAQMYQTLHFKYVQQIYVNYNLIKLFLNIKPKANRKKFLGKVNFTKSIISNFWELSRIRLKCNNNFFQQLRMLKGYSSLMFTFKDYSIRKMCLIQLGLQKSNCINKKLIFLKRESGFTT